MHRHVAHQLPSVTCSIGLDTKDERLQSSKSDWAVRSVAVTTNWTVFLVRSARGSNEIFVLSERPHVGSVDSLGHDFFQWCMKECEFLKQH
jgi:hypothetical protein